MDVAVEDVIVTAEDFKSCSVVVISLACNVDLIAGVFFDIDDIVIVVAVVRVLGLVFDKAVWLDVED